LITYIEGNIFESPAKTLVNTINTAGAMGKGIAREFKKLFPDMFKEYLKLSETGKLEIGQLWLYRTQHKWVLNFPTKKHWRQPSKFEYIDEGLKYFVLNYNKARINSIAFPKLGCGNGELEWRDVKPLMEKHLGKLPIDIYIYTKTENLIPEHKNIKEMQEWLRTQPQYLPYNEVKDDLAKQLKNNNIFHGNKRHKFIVNIAEAGLLIEFQNKREMVFWEGNESGNGLKEIWQYLRTKGICTLEDLIDYGIIFPEIILEIFTQLHYVNKIEVISKSKQVAMHLKPTIANHQKGLFANNDFINFETI
jgi:O-acetyl-ADP-ribose deacetylase (regulator of RNase III)